MLSVIRDSFRQLADLLYPNTCQVCEATIQTKEEILCISCRLKLPETNAHKNKDTELLHRLAGRVPVRYVWAYLYFRKQGSTQRLIHQFKYKGKKETAFALGRWYGQELSHGNQNEPLADLIVGVPLHPIRLRQRGYNQADWLAMGLSESLNIPWRDDVLVRQHFGGSQTKRSKTDRWQNVETAFAVSKPNEVKGKHIMLVDDVLTTGATLEACAAELLNAGAESVGIATIAATQN